MPKKKSQAKKPAKANRPKRKEIGVSYTNREGKRIYVYRSNFDSLDKYRDVAKNITLYAKNPRTLHSQRKRKSK